MIVDFGERATSEMEALAAAHGIHKPPRSEDIDEWADALVDYWTQVIRLVEAFEPDRR